VTTLCKKDHEGLVWNYALDHSTASFTLICDSDIEILNPDFVFSMYTYIVQHSDVGLISCNREGEPQKQRAEVVEWYNDSPAPIFRNCGVRFDGDYLWTQFQDIDVGLEFNFAGYKVMRDQRVSINHEFGDFGAKSVFYHAYTATNRLTLAIKWYKVGRDDWKGKAAYNDSVLERLRIPTGFDLASYSQEQLQRLIDSVELELPWFCEDGDPNAYWVRPW
jgi:hypothetical protein